MELNVQQGMAVKRVGYGMGGGVWEAQLSQGMLRHKDNEFQFVFN